jgi:cysteine sulfinate desulfinase/cysteine desulfurase-like protein
MIYLDHNSTTPVIDEIKHIMIDAMESYNPSSTHQAGRKAKYLVESSRQAILQTIGLNDHDSFYKLWYGS